MTVITCAGQIGRRDNVLRADRGVVQPEAKKQRPAIAGL
jgi:hypothetical protein